MLSYMYNYSYGTYIPVEGVNIDCSIIILGNGVIGNQFNQYTRNMTSDGMWSMCTQLMC